MYWKYLAIIYILWQKSIYMLLQLFCICSIYFDGTAQTDFKQCVNIVNVPLWWGLFLNMCVIQLNYGMAS